MGLTWFFENIEAGIILEDDCIPDPTFFDFGTVKCDTGFAAYFVSFGTTTSGVSTDSGAVSTTDTFLLFFGSLAKLI
jgi:hypothetical protein